MKKILVVLLVLAVAGGVFAQQGEWSISGQVLVGTYIDLDNDVKDTDPDEEVIYYGSAYHQPYDWWNPMQGKLGLAYNMENGKIGIDFDQKDGLFGGSYEYNGENFKMAASADLYKITNTDLFGDGQASIGSLWGSYELLNGLVQLEAAFKSRSTQFWNSDTTGAFWGNNTNYGGGNPVATLKLGGKPDIAVIPLGGDSFTAVDGNNYFLTNVVLQGISFGVMLPNLFATELYDSNGSGRLVPAKVQKEDFPGDLSSWDQSNGYSLVEGVLKQITFGLKFEMSPIEVAAQIIMKDFGVYFGGKWFVGPVTAGLSFMGILDQRDGAGHKVDNARTMKVGGGVDYNADSFGASIKGYLGLSGITTGANKTQLGVVPSFYYNVIPTHLRFQTDIGFYFTNSYIAAEKQAADSFVTWSVRPQLFWNFLGTGAGDWWGFNTGMVFRYVVVSDAINALDITFKFSF